MSMHHQWWPRIEDIQVHVKILWIHNVKIHLINPGHTFAGTHRAFRISVCVTTKPLCPSQCSYKNSAQSKYEGYANCFDEQLNEFAHVLGLFMCGFHRKKVCCNFDSVAFVHDSFEVRPLLHLSTYSNNYFSEPPRLATPIWLAF